MHCGAEVTESSTNKQHHQEWWRACRFRCEKKEQGKKEMCAFLQKWPETTREFWF